MALKTECHVLGCSCKIESTSKRCQVPRKYEKAFLVLICIFVVILVVIVDQRVIPSFETKSKPISRSASKTASASATKKKLVPSKKNKCPNVLEFLSKGHWVQRPMTKDETFHYNKYLNDTRIQGSILPSISSPDGSCGNTSLPYNRNLRSLCYPTSSKPCCYQGRCTDRTVEDCRCADCYDMRQRIIADYATWVPEDKRCKFRRFSTKEACRLLKNSTIFLLGDSHFRHLYTAMLILLRNDPKHGGLRENVKEKWSRCPGPYMFGSKACRPLLDLKATGLCNGSFAFRYVSQTEVEHGSEVLDTLKRNTGIPNVLVLASIAGRHNNSVTELQKYIMPSIKYLKDEKIKWPKLMWANAHAPGLLKSPKYVNQSYKKTKSCNERMSKIMKGLGIPVFDTFNMTSTTVSFDGTHYDMGVTTAKIHLLLNYLMELRSKGEW